MSIQSYIDHKIHKRNLGIYFRGGRWLFHIVTLLMTLFYYHIIYISKCNITGHRWFSWQQTLLLTAPFIIFFYTFCLVLIPLCFKQNKLKKFWSYFLIAMLIFPLIEYGAYQWVKSNFLSQLNITIYSISIGKAYLNFITGFIGCCSILYFMELLEEISSNKESWQNQEEIAATELRRIKTQMHPEFMVRSLGGIAALAQNKNDHAPEAVVDFSDVLRYRLYRSKEKLIALEQELSQLQKLIQLHNYLPQQNGTAELEINGTPEQYWIVPLSLLNIAEAMLATFKPEQDWNMFLFLLIDDNEIQVALELNSSPNAAINTQIESLRTELEQILYSGINFTVETQESSYSLRVCIPIFKK